MVRPRRQLGRTVDHYPDKAVHILRMPFTDDFESLRLGHLVGDGMDLWDARVLDLVGLPPAAAALAYGPWMGCRHCSASSRFRRSERAKSLGCADPQIDPQDFAAAYAIARRAAVPAPGSLDARMAEEAASHPAPLLGAASPVSAKDLQAAQSACFDSLLLQLRRNRNSSPRGTAV